jgi:AbrB family looped-hinge helix DNA binding protein
MKRRYERQKMKTFTAEIKSRGQLTIPKKIRVMSHLEEGQIVSIIPVGDSVIIVPKRLELDDARREIKRMLKETGVSLDDLLADLKEEREKLYHDTYGKRTS